jgi:hypothetical protein
MPTCSLTELDEKIGRFDVLHGHPSQADSRDEEVGVDIRFCYQCDSTFMAHRDAPVWFLWVETCRISHKSPIKLSTG